MDDILKQFESGDIDGVIFDCDCVADTTQAIWKAWRQVCELHSLKPLSMKKCRENLGRRTRDLVILILQEEFGDKFATKTRDMDIDDICSSYVKFADRAIFEAGTPPIPVVEDIVRSAADKSLRIAVTSEQRREMVIQYLSSCGLLNLFDAIVTSEDVKNNKPAPDLFLEAAKRMKCDPTKCLGFEYDDNGLSALTAAGMRPVDVKLLKGFPEYADFSALNAKNTSAFAPSNQALGLPLWTVVLALLIALCVVFLKLEGNIERLLTKISV